MENHDHKQWSEQHGRYIYRDQDGNWMIDEFGPTDEFSLLRELHKMLADLISQRSDLSPNGPVPNSEYSRFRARYEGDVDALACALLDEEIDSLKQVIQDEINREHSVSLGKKGGRPGMDEKIFLRDLQTVLNELKAVSEKNPHKKITHSRIAQELINKHGYDRTKKYLADKVSKTLKNVIPIHSS